MVSEDFGMIRERRSNQYLVEHKTANGKIVRNRMKPGYSGVSETEKTGRKTRIYTTFTPIQIKTPKKYQKSRLNRGGFFIFSVKYTSWLMEIQNLK